MRAAVLHGKRDLRVEDISIPDPAVGEVLVKVACVGVCGTDHSEWWNGPRSFPILDRHPVSGHIGPMVLGHEFSGTVVDCGPGIPESWNDRRIVSSAAISCGDCGHCRSGRTNLCPTYHGLGLHRDGALAQFVAAPVSALFDITESPLTLDEAALAQPMAIAHHAVRRGAPAQQSSVLVQGVGGIGAFIVRVLVEQGHRVIAVDVATSRLQIAEAMGAEITVEVGSADDIVISLSDLVRRHGINLAYEVSGTAVGLETLQSAMGVGARIVLVGIQKQGQPYDLGSVTLREQELVGTNGLVHARDLPAAVRTLEQLAGSWAGIAPVVYPLEAVTDEVLGGMSRSSDQRPIKSLIDPWSSSTRALA